MFLGERHKVWRVSREMRRRKVLFNRSTWLVWLVSFFLEKRRVFAGSRRIGVRNLYINNFASRCYW